jgi:antitoxin VapB
MSLLQPLAEFDSITADQLNHALVDWGHQMGPWRRPEFSRPLFHGLWVSGTGLVAVTAADQLIGETAGGLRRDEAIELGRVCACGPDWCRVALCLWRMVVFPAVCRARGVSWAVSYQDAVIHTGNLYRHDGWVRLGFSRSGTDARSGRRGRNKVIWGWCADPVERQARRVAA